MQHSRLYKWLEMPCDFAKVKGFHSPSADNCPWLATNNPANLCTRICRLTCVEAPARQGAYWIVRQLFTDVSINSTIFSIPCFSPF